MADFSGGMRDKYFLLLTAAFDPDLVASDIRVLAVLCDRYNQKNGCCWSTSEGIAEDTGLSNRHVRRAIRKLRIAEYIDMELRHHDATLFTLNWERIRSETFPTAAKV